MYIFISDALSGRSYLRSNSNFNSINWDAVGICNDFHLLWTKRTNEHRIWGVWPEALPVQLVFIANWNGTNVFDIHIEHSTAKNYSRLWQYSVYKGYIHKSNLLFDHMWSKENTEEKLITVGLFWCYFHFTRQSIRDSHILWRFDNWTFEDIL